LEGKAIAVTLSVAELYNKKIRIRKKLGENVNKRKFA
jgi:hypothetical protein